MLDADAGGKPETPWGRRDDRVLDGVWVVGKGVSAGRVGWSLCTAPSAFAGCGGWGCFAIFVALIVRDFTTGAFGFCSSMMY